MSHPGFSGETYMSFLAGSAREIRAELLVIPSFQSFGIENPCSNRRRKCIIGLKFSKVAVWPSAKADHHVERPFVERHNRSMRSVFADRTTGEHQFRNPQSVFRISQLPDSVSSMGRVQILFRPDRHNSGRIDVVVRVVVVPFDVVEVDRLTNPWLLIQIS